MALKEEYLNYISRAREETIKNYEESIRKWETETEHRGFWGFSPPGLPITCAFLESFLFSETGERGYAEVALERLSSYGEFTKYCPEDEAKNRPEYSDGIPPIPNIFSFLPYLDAYIELKSRGVVDPESEGKIRENIASSIPSIFSFPEWGAHNRTLLRAAGLAAAARAVPDHPDSENWLRMARFLGEDSITKWSIEDTSLYHPVWLFSVIHYVDTVGEPNFFESAITRYYFEYILNLLSPSGGIADFGDATWHCSLGWYLPCFERGASEYSDPFLKYAAQGIFDLINSKKPSGGEAQHLVHAYRWADDSVPAKRPSSGSSEVMDDLFGKKIVFRNGWDQDSTFLLLNYKDENNFGKIQRDYLKTTLSVEAEKAHHGHADENSICLLMSGGSILLHDGGYRENLPNGKYRADYYHNRVIVRKESYRGKSPILDFLSDSGKYKNVDTEKIDFVKFEQVEMSRTRVMSPKMGYFWDRVLVYLKHWDIFVIFDGLFATSTGDFTFSNLLYTRQVASEGAGYFDTYIDRIADYENRGKRSLLIRFADMEEDGFTGTDRTRRSYQDEVCVHRTISRSMARSDIVPFVTALIPHNPDADVEALARSISPIHTDRYPKGVGARINLDGDTVIMGVKLDLDLGIHRKNIRPRYSYRPGAIRYGDIQTDAAFVYLRESDRKVHYSVTEATGLSYSGRKLFHGKPFSFHLQPSGDPVRYGVPRWRGWEDEVSM